MPSISPDPTTQQASLDPPRFDGIGLLCPSDIVVGRSCSPRQWVTSGRRFLSWPAHPRLPTDTRLLALAHHFDGLLREGVVRDHAELAALAHVSRARITQIMNLLLLAPDIQEDILHLPRTVIGRDPIRETHLRPIVQVVEWLRQQGLWQQLRRTCLLQ